MYQKEVSRVSIVGWFIINGDCTFIGIGLIDSSEGGRGEVSGIGLIGFSEGGRGEVEGIGLIDSSEGGIGDAILRLTTFPLLSHTIFLSPESKLLIPSF